MGIFPAAIAYVAYGYYLARATASRAVSYLYIVPVLAIVIAWLWLGELPRGLSLLGGAISLAGVAIVQLWGHGKRVVSS
jgi:drug/metabolite transporter (DMT)-like permease